MHARPQVPTFGEVSSAEAIFFPPRLAGRLLPLRFLPLEAVAADPARLGQLLRRHRGDGYLLELRAPEALPPHRALGERLWERCASCGAAHACLRAPPLAHVTRA